MRRRHLTFPFSLFTFQFISRRRHHTFHLSLFTFHFISRRRRCSFYFYHSACLTTPDPRYKQKKVVRRQPFCIYYTCVAYALKSSTSEASLSSIYEAASVIFFAAYFTKTLAGATYSSASAAWRSTICEMMI